MPVNPKFKFALKNEDSNFTLINNHGKPHSTGLALRRSEVSVKSLQALGSSTRPTWSDRSPEGLSSYGVVCTTFTIQTVHLIYVVVEATWPGFMVHRTWSRGLPLPSRGFIEEEHRRNTGMQASRSIQTIQRLLQILGGFQRAQPGNRKSRAPGMQ